MLGNKKTDQDFLMSLKEAGIRKYLTTGLCHKRQGGCEAMGSIPWQRELCEEARELQQRVTLWECFLGLLLQNLRPLLTQGPCCPHWAFIAPSHHPPTLLS